MQKRETLTGHAVVVLDRGFVYVGEVEIDEAWCVISNARNIRYWGTKNGLGELVLNGPQKETNLDAVGTVRAPMHAVISVMDTEAAKWNSC